MFTAVIPSYNSSRTISKLIHELFSCNKINEIIVVDNNSDDDSWKLAEQAGAIVLGCRQQGQGAALKVGIAHAKYDHIFKVDGDVQNLHSAWIDAFAKAMDNKGVVKGYWNSDVDPLPVTNLVVKPLIRKFTPDLTWIKMPVAAIYAVDRCSLNLEKLPDGWAFDLELLLQAHENGWDVGQVYLPIVYDDLKPVLNYTNMSFDLINHMVKKYTNDINLIKCIHIGHSLEDIFLEQGGLILKELYIGADIHIISFLEEDSSTMLSQKIHKASNINNAQLQFSLAIDEQSLIEELQHNKIDILTITNQLSKQFAAFMKIISTQPEICLLETLPVDINPKKEITPINISDFYKAKYKLCEHLGCSISKVETRYNFEADNAARTGGRWSELYIPYHEYNMRGFPFS